MGSIVSEASKLVGKRIAKCREIAEDVEFKAASAYKTGNHGAKLIGYFPVYLPEEIVYAAGMMPVEVIGAGNRLEIDYADSIIQSFVCSISRSTLELAITERMKDFDGMLFSSICDVARNLSGVFKRQFPHIFVDYIHYPQNMSSPSARDYLATEYKRLIWKLEELSGIKVTDDALKRAIETGNRSRELLRALYNIRASSPWLISASELFVVTRASTLMPKTEFIPLIEEILAGLSDRDRKMRDCVRVVIEGSFCELPPVELLEEMEEAGCYIVDDDLVLGSRWYLDSIPTDGDPLGALVDSYFKRSVYSSVRHYGNTPRAKNLVEKVRSRRAEGVIFCTAKFCEPALFDYALNKELLEKEGIPYIAVEFEEKAGVFEGIKTQVETFVESILFFS